MTSPGAAGEKAAPSAAPDGGHRPQPPRLTSAAAERLASDVYGIEGAASELPSERDQNFLLRTTTGDAFVLKLSETHEDIEFLECQHLIVTQLTAALPRYRFPEPRPAVTGRLIEAVPAPGGEHLVRLLHYVPGVPLARLRRHSPALLEGIGRLMGSVDSALVGFTHPAARRELRWDLRQGREIVGQHVGLLRDPARRALVEHFVGLFDEVAVPLLTELRTGVIHGDANDWNLIVDVPADPLTPAAIAGLIDFGDVVDSWVAAEPAIAAAYAMLDKREPLAAAAHVVRGYHDAHPLSEAEMEALFPLIALRLCTSVVLSAHQRSLRPENDYLSISEQAAWRLLEQLRTVHPRLAHYQLRDACGLVACPRVAAVTGWLEKHGASFGPVLQPDPRASRCLVFDLSPGSLDLHRLHDRSTPAAWTQALAAQMADAAVGVGIGRYGEVRRRGGEASSGEPTEDRQELRTLHVGLDLFALPGTQVLAPMDGRVHGIQNEGASGDRGSTIMLRHEMDGGAFFTLYRHLATVPPLELQPGKEVRRGQLLGHVGEAAASGGSAAHLHVQLVLDPLDSDVSFPGMVRPSQRRLWMSLSPDPNLLLRIPQLASAATAPSAAEGGAAADRRAPLDADRIAAARRRHIAPNLSLSYRRPLHIVRGWMQHLYDADGQQYLDCVNNVAHVGHSHPRVVEAIARQSAVLNTNTRYLHENLVRYAERLAAKLPEPLSVCFFVNSGSEANELALRLASAHTGRRDVIVLDAAYHGNTGALVDLSPYKLAGAGGYAPPSTTHVVPLPDPYRGTHRGDTPQTARAYAGQLRDMAAGLEREGRAAAAFLFESLPGCGGQIVLPPSYLAEAFSHVRAAGGVCIADEVQVGFGRVGTHFWGFETHGAVPDIVTMGKPIGNGHPLGAVVTTPQIAASFANGMEYFNTFGGNPVSCAAGLAVLDVLAEEALQDRALNVGERLVAELRTLMATHPLIGDVRGRGLYLGIELVLDRGTLEPAPRHAAFVIERMRDRGILLSTDGPLHNVIKIKPPLQFSEEDAESLVFALDSTLQELSLIGSGGI